MRVEHEQTSSLSWKGPDSHSAPQSPHQAVLPIAPSRRPQQEQVTRNEQRVPYEPQGLRQIN